MSITEQLNLERDQLLDIGTRNRLISTQRRNKRAKQIEVVHERSADLYDLLVRQGKTMTFLPLGSDEDEEAEGEDTAQQMLLALMAAESESDYPDHFGDTKLQTDLRPTKLQKRLRDLFNDSRTFVEEQGVNPLFLALGFLRWRESKTSERDRFAPLILLPAEITRGDLQSKFTLTASDDDLSTNLSLQQKLKSDFDLVLPDLPATDDLDVEQYFDDVADCISGQSDWEVLRNDVQLSFFQFAKFLMYRDLDPENWPEECQLEGNPLLGGLLRDGFGPSECLIGEDDRIEDKVRPADMVHVVDADSSQAAAIEEVRQGRNMVIQGPPGTGKSQTITNLIATGVREGKKILFLSEKMAALDVVKQRLESIGLGDMCLELHSNKSRKKTVLAELDRTLKLRRQAISADLSVNERVERLSRSLNRTVDAIHRPIGQSGATAYAVIGKLTALHSLSSFEESVRKKITLPEAESWAKVQFDEYTTQLAAFADLTDIIGSPKTHPFRGAECGILLRSDMEALEANLKTLQGLVTSVAERSDLLAKSLRISAAGVKIKVSELNRLADIGDAIASSPEVDREAIRHDVWESRLEWIGGAVERGKEFCEARSRLDGKLNDGVDDIDVTSARRHLNAYGRQFFLLRLFNGKYRTAFNTLKEILRDSPPTDLSQQLQILDDVILTQSFRNEFSDGTDSLDSCRAAFGELWKGEESDWGLLEKIVNWTKECEQENIHPQLRVIRGKYSGNPQHLAATVSGLRELAADLQSQTTNVLQRLAMPLRRLGVETIDGLSLADLDAWVKTALERLESLADWTRYRLKRNELVRGGLQSTVRLLDEGEVEPARVGELFELSYYEYLLRHAFDNSPEISQFSGMSFESMREQFRAADHAMIDATRHEVSNIHRTSIPQGTMGGMRVLRHEIQKKARHKALRRLIKEAGPAIQDIKPVFMMSPLSVAQYLEPGSVEFDLLLIDEASQVEPVDALGAVSRCRQIVVVGDDKQLPPTRFFARSAELSEEEDSGAARDLESILGLCVARGIPQKMLMWHYRSQHQSLIAVSNQEYYENKLFVVPSPVRNDAAYGVKFVYVEDGVYDRGRTSANAPEARVVAQHVIEHARNHPDLSLGVAAFSVAQKNVLLDEIELLQRDNPELSPFFTKTGAQEFFVKNLETVQGDERDVIFISVGYGKDDVGYMSQNFGPLNREGGERRLNVLISRAKQKCTVFSSITSDDITLSGATKKGVTGLKKFLQFAENGYTDIGEITGRGYDSEFEREVATSISGYGHNIETQVGVAGFFVDLAVVDPQQPGRYLLGIECDGATYHSSRSARDRDRLREEVLKSRGWKLHRIWSTDWYQQPETELQKVLVAIEAAEAGKAIPANPSHPHQIAREPENGRPQPQPSAPSAAETTHHATDENEVFGIPVEPYREVSTDHVSSASIVDMPAGKVDRLCLKVISVEGPIQRQEIARRLAALTGTRASSRLTDVCNKSLWRLTTSEKVDETDGFMDVAGGRCTVVRDRSEVRNATLRKPENIAPAEISLCVVLLLKENGNAERDELIRTVAKVLGFKQAGRKLRDVVSAGIDDLVGLDELSEKNSVVSINDWEKCQVRLNSDSGNDRLF